MILSLSFDLFFQELIGDYMVIIFISILLYYLFFIIDDL